MENYTQLFTQDPDDYLADMATTEYNLGKLYHHNLLDYSKAEEHYLKALENRTQLFTQNPETYRTDLAWNKYNLGSLYYYHLHNYAKASDYYTGAMELFNLYPERYREDLASTLNMLAYSFAHQKDFSKAIETIDRAIALMPEKANYYDSKGEILLMKGDEQEAVKMWQKVLELDPDFLSKHEDGTDFYKQLKARGLIE